MSGRRPVIGTGTCALSAVAALWRTSPGIIGFVFSFGIFCGSTFAGEAWIRQMGGAGLVDWWIDGSSFAEEASEDRCLMVR